MRIKLEDVVHVYNEDMPYETLALDHISLEISPGEFVGIIGHTGSGKSTLVQHLNGILKPKSGKIFIGEKEITAKGVKLIDVRKKIGLIFQYPEYQLFEETVYKDIAFGPINLGLSEESVDERVKEALELVSLNFDEFAERSPFELSGGQKRRVAIAGVIAMEPKILVLDEPTAGLDPKAHKDILTMIEGIREKKGITVILISHNMGDIANLAERIFVMDKGRLLMTGTPKEIFSKGEQLKEIGLALPPIKELIQELSYKGIDLDSNILTIEEAEEAIDMHLQRKRKYD